MAEKRQMMTKAFEDSDDATSCESEDKGTSEPHIPVAPRHKDIPRINTRISKSIYDDLDSGLTWCQSTCETAAHKILRSGDCETEIDGMKERFAKTMTLAKEFVFKIEEERRKGC